MNDALRLIISKSPNATTEAMMTLRAISANSPVVQTRYNHTVQIAFNDYQANFTADERALISSYLEAAQTGGNRDKLIQVRVTAEEKDYLQRAAGEAGYADLSSWTRNLWKLD
jgi:hypothetical protein